MIWFDPAGIKKEGKGLPTPQSGTRLFFYLLWNHGFRLVGLNFMTLACCIPVITAPAAICAMNRVLIKLVREANVLLWEEFRDEFRMDFLASLPLGLLYGGGMFTAYFLMSLGMGNSGNFFGMVFFALGVVLAWFSVSQGAYAFLLRAMLPLRNRDILRNARAMASGTGCFGWLPPLVVSVEAAALGILFPFSLILLAPFFPVLGQYVICFFLNSPIQRRIIDPWEALQE